jgi:two-component system phosphate regulon sensor histidine kinase PhoR
MATLRARWRAFRRMIAWRDMFRAAALLWLPVALVMAVLVGIDALSPALAGGALVAVFLGLAAMLAGHFRDLRRVRDYVERLRARRESSSDIPDPPDVTSRGLDRQLPEAIAESARAREAHRKELDAAIQGNEMVLSHLPDPLLLLDANGNVRRANRAAARLFGARLEGRPLAAIIRHPDLLRETDAVLQGDAQREVEFSSPGEIEMHVSARIASLVGPTPDNTVAVISLHDVTAIRRAEQMRADFVANASHELRTPLSSLLGFIETLQGPAKEDAEARDRFLAIMLEQSRRMYNLVEDLLSLSRIELDEHTPPTGRADMARIAERVVASLELRAKKKDMRIDLDLEAESLPVMGDGDQLAQVVQNLVDNAIKYGQAGTTVHVSGSLSGENTPRRARRGVALSVVDHGEGIPREHLPRLTERFYRVDKARSRDLGGTGLGLAIVKHILNRHRGDLQVDSTVGEGSRFTIYIPASPERGEADAPPGKADAPHGGG